MHLMLLPICQEFGNMSQLEFLGLSATQLQKSSVQSITRLHISKVLLVLGDTYGEREDAESLQDLKTQSLHIVFPQERNSILIWTCQSAPQWVWNCLISNVLDDNGCSYFKMFCQNFKKNSRLSNLTLNNIEITWNSFITIPSWFGAQTLSIFPFQTWNYKVTLTLEILIILTPPLKTLSIHKAVHDVFSLPQGYVYKILSNMNIQHLTVSAAHMVHLVCPSQISPFLYLNFPISNRHGFQKLYKFG